MGCAASASAPESPVSKGEEKRRLTNGKVDPRSPAYRKVAAPAPSVDTSVLSVALLNDLRQKSSGGGAPPLQAWIQNITEPSDGDNADLFDPLRRHQLSMESVEFKKRSMRYSSSSCATATQDGVSSDSIPCDNSELGESKIPIEVKGDVSQTAVDSVVACDGGS